VYEGGADKTREFIEIKAGARRIQGECSLGEPIGLLRRSRV